MDPSPATSVREAAARWTLAGDSQLLEVLQTLHQRIVSKCEDTSRRLEEMLSSLDLASVHLANVNNKFLALSNSQFVESRVYEDDADVSANTLAHTAPDKMRAKPASAECEVERLKQSVRVLESFHETVTILRESDSESDSDDGDISRVVLKPKDLYSTRPLPHIIGSAAWRNKWHAGLVVETSDSDSEVSGRGGVVEQYSESEEEDVEEEPLELERRAHTRTESTTSSDMTSEREPPRPPAGRPAPSPAAVAAELARRLGAHTAHVPEVAESSPPQPAQRKVYRAEKPAPGAIFLDEPPPLESSDEDSEQDDIFAELHRNKPYSNTSRDYSRLADDLFGHNDLFSENQPYSDRNKVERDDEGDIFSDFAHVPKNEIPTRPSVKQKPSLFEDEEEPELFTQKPTQPVSDAEHTSGIKKPVGGVSLFGPNKNSESIGAAILKRNQPKSFTSDEESNHSVRELPKAPNKREETPQIATKVDNKNEKDIFDDLFAKSEKVQKKNVQLKTEIDVAKKPEKKVDLFSDNLFDDIDDIFTSNIVTKVAFKEPSKGQKSLFDDVDDLFADIDAKTDSKVSKKETKISKETEPSNDKKNTNIFDSDDELFNEKTVEVKPDSQKIIKPSKSSESTKIIEATKVNDTTKVKETKSLFDDSDKDIFSNGKLTTPAQKSKNNDTQTKEINKTDFEIKSSINTYNSKINNSKNLQENIDEDGELFFNKNTGPEIKTKITPNIVVGEDSDDIFTKPKIEKSKSVINSTNLFDDDDEVDLFAKSITASENSSAESKDDELFKSNPKHDQKQYGFASSVTKEDEISTETVTVDNEDNILTNANEENLPDSKNSQNINSSKRKGTEAAKKIDNISRNEILDENEFTPPNKNSNAKEESITKIIKEDSVMGKPFVFEEPVETPNNIFDDNDEELFKKPVETTYLIQEGDNIPAPLTSITQTTVIKKVSTKEQDCEQTETKTAELVTTKTEINKPVKKKELDNMRKVDANKNLTVINTSEPKDNKPDVFSDIFDDQPPIFEKPKEPKRSKNVNALFDDDSDDEALFFRKSDVLLDEKSDDFGTNSNQDLFRVFIDEPPAIDTFDDALNNTPVDFITEPNKNMEKETENVRIEEDLYTPQIKDNVQIDKASLSVPTVLPTLENEPSDDIDSAISQDQNVDTKKIGKLKPMNFSINVSSLLPGASPKKTQKTNEQTDGQAISTINNVDTSNDKEMRTKLVKSVSFDSDPESSVLNNQLSKERAKIQVKRRPSTRRARREAVKKSGIDFGEDSTDNSSSIDDPPRKHTIYASNKKNDQEKRIETLVHEGKGNISRDSTDYSDSVTSSPSNKKGAVSNDSSNQETNSISNIVGKAVVSELENETKSPTKDSPSRDVKSKIVYVLNDEDIFSNVAPQAAVTSSKSEKVKPENKRTKTLKIVDDNDDIFKTIAVVPTVETPEIKNTIEGINTLGKVYTESKRIKQNVEDTKQSNAGSNISQHDSDDDIFKDFANTANTSRNSKLLEHTSINTNKSKNEIIPNKNHKGQSAKSKKSIFDDLSDEENELFNTNQNTIPKKPTIFNSDSEEDLFAGGSKRETKKKDIREVKSEITMLKKEIKKVEVKSSLFGDEDDDDDLFGVKTKKVTDLKPVQATSAKEASNKMSQPAFEDPLSLFDDH